MDCEMHIFSSECQTCNVVIDREMGCYDIVKHRSSKVVSASGTCLAWINMWHGVLLCNVIDKDSVLRLLQ